VTMVDMANKTEKQMQKDKIIKEWEKGKRETKIVKECLDYLQYLENLGIVYALRTASGMIVVKEKDKPNRIFKTGKPGAPDIVFCWRRKFCGLEVKRIDGIQSPAQKETERKIQKAGGLYFLIDGVSQLEWLNEK